MESLANSLCHVLVAIGYSAGGHFALTSFFGKPPCNTASYVLLRHFSFNQKKFLTRFLQKHPSLEVIEVDHPQQIENNKVYILPAHQYLLISNGSLFCHPRPVRRYGVSRAIDFFLHSLSLEARFKKIAVILSGYGKDGAIGAALLRKSGGKVLIQRPDTCFASSMPAEVLKATEVDYVTVPEEMPAIIEAYARLEENQSL